MVFLATWRWMFRFLCWTYPLVRFGFTMSAVANERVAGRVRTGADGCTGSGGAVPMRASVPAELGNRVEDCEKPGVAPSPELDTAPTMRS
jgi:hypothetical protein